MLRQRSITAQDKVCDEAIAEGMRLGVGARRARQAATAGLAVGTSPRGPATRAVSAGRATPAAPDHATHGAHSHPSSSRAAHTLRIGSGRRAAQPGGGSSFASRRWPRPRWRASRLTRRSSPPVIAPHLNSDEARYSCCARLPMSCAILHCAGCAIAARLTQTRRVLGNRGNILPAAQTHVLAEPCCRGRLRGAQGAPAVCSCGTDSTHPWLSWCRRAQSPDGGRGGDPPWVTRHPLAHNAGSQTGQTRRLPSTRGALLVWERAGTSCNI